MNPPFKIHGFAFVAIFKVSDLKKRRLKSPRIYVRDSGLLHSLLELAA